MTKPGTPITERLFARREMTESGCWLWTGTVNNCGYGQIKVGQKNWYAHRLAYVTLVGPIPDDRQLDHLCRNRACFNPSHLEPVEPLVNVMRGNAWSAVNLRKTHCPQGHPLSQRGSETRRHCKECQARHDAARGQRIRRDRAAARLQESARPCAGCEGQIPPTMRRHAVYCSRACKDRAHGRQAAAS